MRHLKSIILIDGLVRDFGLGLLQFRIPIFRLNIFVFINKHHCLKTCIVYCSFRFLWFYTMMNWWSSPIGEVEGISFYRSPSHQMFLPEDFWLSLKVICKFPSPVYIIPTRRKATEFNTAKKINLTQLMNLVSSFKFTCLQIIFKNILYEFSHNPDNFFNKLKNLWKVQFFSSKQKIKF